MENQHRPYINFWIVFRKSNGELCLRIQNTGDRIAKEVTIKTTPPLTSSVVNDYYAKLYFPSLPPDFDFEVDFDDMPESQVLKYDVIVEYKSDNQEYQDKYVIDLTLFIKGYYNYKHKKTVLESEYINGKKKGEETARYKIK